MNKVKIHSVSDKQGGISARRREDAMRRLDGLLCPSSAILLYHVRVLEISIDQTSPMPNSSSTAATFRRISRACDIIRTNFWLIV